MKFSSFDVLSMVLEEANERFAPLFQPVPERVDILKQYCSALDGLIGQFDGEEFECEVDEINMTVRLSLVLTDIIVENAKDAFQQLVARSLSVRIEPHDRSHIKVSLVFPSLWEKI